MKENSNSEEFGIFKFYEIDKYLYDLLINHEVWFSHPESFNDPFDSNLNLKEMNSLEDLIELNKDLLKNEHVKNRLKELSENPLESKKVARSFESIDAESVQEFGISCFSYKKDEILMWSHYADNHKGVCIKFNPLLDDDFFRLRLDVEYVEEYPEIDWRNTDLIDRLSQNIKYKHINWEYESEVRVIKLDGNGLKKIKLGSISEIIFGCKCSEEDKRSIIRLVAKLGYEQVKISEAKIKHKEFALEFKELGVEYEDNLKMEIHDEILEMMFSKMKLEIKEENIRVVDTAFKETVGPLFEELYTDAIKFLLSLENEEAIIDFLDKHLPQNKEHLLESLNTIKQRKNKNKNGR